jgi:methyl-accepting chemotaxis protein
MISLSNMKLGKKITLVLGGAILLLVGLSGLSMWAIGTNQNLAETLVKRLTKARLAATIAGDTSAIAQNMGKMILAKGTADDVVSRIVDLRKSRDAALQQFKVSADNPASVKQGADMAGLIKATDASNDNVMTWLAVAQYEDAIKDFGVSSSAADSLHAKAAEASLWQETRVAEDEKVRKEKSRTIWAVLIGGSLLGAIAGIYGGFALTRGIATPVATVLAHLDQIAQGDLSQDASPELQTRADEIGALARGTQTMTVALRKMIHEISSGIGVLSLSSAELTATSTQMTSGSRQASDKAHSVAAAAEEMSSNIASVAAGMEQTTANLAHVSSATEQMTSTIGEIARDSEKARGITDEAMRQAARITVQINELGAAAREIGKVTETITEISSQTNLLALNATIEAARAGSAGKGFAVVATEIKALAQQTAAATEDIKRRIAGVQAATAGGITEIGKVSQVISEVSAIVAGTAAAIEQQSAAIKDIARNIADASMGVTEANTRVSESSQVSREIARDIVTVDSAAGELARGSDHVRTSAGELSTVAEALRVTVSRFQA